MRRSLPYRNKIQYSSDRNPYSLRNVVSEKLQIPKAKTELFKKTFTYSGPKLWNELPFSIRQASSHNAFKTKVFGESKDFYQTTIRFYFLNIQVLHSLDILKQEDIYDI
jgi:hypothetical protein